MGWVTCSTNVTTLRDGLEHVKMRTLFCAITLHFTRFGLIFVRYRYMYHVVKHNVLGCQVKICVKH